MGFFILLMILLYFDFNSKCSSFLSEKCEHRYSQSTYISIKSNEGKVSGLKGKITSNMCVCARVKSMYNFARFNTMHTLNQYVPDFYPIISGHGMNSVL